MLDDRTGASVPIPAHLGIFVWSQEKNIGGVVTEFLMAPGAIHCLKV